MYLIKGDENFFINQNLEDIKEKIINKQANKKQLKVINFYLNANFEEIIDALSNIDMFYSKKLIIFQNIDFLNSKAKVSESACNEILYLLKHLDEDIEIIFTQYIEKYDKNFSPSKIYKFVEDNAKIIEANKINDHELFPYINKLVHDKGGTIEASACIGLISAFPNDLALINNEIDKLFLLSKNITTAMVSENNLTISDNLDWSFSNSLIKYNNIIEILQKFKEQLNFGVNGSQIINQISTILYDSHYFILLRKKYSSDGDIAKVLGIHEYRVKLIKDFVLKKGVEKIENLILTLSQIDIDIKNGLIDETLAIKTFILDLIN